MSNRGVGPFEQQLRLPQAFAFQCDMLVWRNASGVLGPMMHPGHAALVLRRTVAEGPWHGKAGLNFGLGTPDPELDPASYRYVSFWPYGDKDGLFDATSAVFHKNHLEDMGNELGENARRMLDNDQTQPREGQIVIGQDRNLQDIWGQRHQAMVPVLGLTGARADKLGLSLNRIVSWATRFRGSEEFNYIFASKTKNCAGVAIRAMQAGGADAFAQLGGNPAKPSFYMLPNDAQRWANAVSLGVAECNRMLEVLRNRTRFLAVAPPGDLMSLKDWKARSDVAWTLRGRLTAAIDKALGEYHGKEWGRDFERKLKLLVTIIRNVHDHLREDTKRDAAYLTLANQVMAVVGALARSGDTPWTPESFYGTRYGLG